MDIVELCTSDRFADSDIRWCFAVQRRVDALHILIGLELGERALEVTPAPKQYMVEILSPRGADEPFY